MTLKNAIIKATGEGDRVLYSSHTIAVLESRPRVMDHVTYCLTLLGSLVSVEVFLALRRVTLRATGPHLQPYGTFVEPSTDFLFYGLVLAALTVAVITAVRYYREAQDVYRSQHNPSRHVLTMDADRTVRRQSYFDWSREQNRPPSEP